MSIFLATPETAGAGLSKGAASGDVAESLSDLGSAGPW